MASSEAAINHENLQLVQELIKKPIISIPQNYVVRSNQENLISCSSSPTTIPTIDFNLLLSKQTTNLELQKLHSTCKEWGIFQIVNHGIRGSLVEKLKHEIEEFYNLPLEERMKYKVRAGEVEGYGNHGKFDEKLYWGDRFYMITNPISRRRPHLLPLLPSSLRNSLERYIVEMQKLAMKLLELLGDCLKIEKKEMEEMFDDGMQGIRMTYYPPCPQPELVLGFTPHSDSTGITILNQLNGVDGLQVQKDGLWFPVSFLPDSLVVNIGDILEIMSNGLYKSIEHRVTVNSEKERMSIAFFANPKFEAVIGPAPSVITPQNPPKFRRILTEDYAKGFFSQRLDGKSYLDSMKIN